MKPYLIFSALILSFIPNENYAKSCGEQTHQTILWGKVTLEETINSCIYQLSATCELKNYSEQIPTCTKNLSKIPKQMQKSAYKLCFNEIENNIKKYCE